MTGHQLGDGIPNPPLHNLLAPHDNRYWMDERGCPPNCQYRQWAEKYLAPPVLASNGNQASADEAIDITTPGGNP